MVKGKGKVVEPEPEPELVVDDARAKEPVSDGTTGTTTTTPSEASPNLLSEPNEEIVLSSEQEKTARTALEVSISIFFFLLR